MGKALKARKARRNARKSPYSKQKDAAMKDVSKKQEENMDMVRM